MSHDQNFKNLILDYPRQALTFFAADEADEIDEQVRITPVRQEQLQGRLGERFRELDVPLLVEWPDKRREILLFALEEESDARRFSIHRLAHYCLDLAEMLNTTRVVPVVIFLRRANNSECRRARDAKRDIPVPLSPCARATTCTCRGRPAPGPRLRHFAPPPDPYDEWLDGVSDALASGLRQLRDLRPLRHFGQPLAPTPTADYPPRASRFPGGQR